MKRIGVIYHPLNKAALELSRRIIDLLTSLGYEDWICSAWDGDKIKNSLPQSELIITAGGDGTILRAAQAVMPGEIPILSINLGKLGFLTEISAKEALDKIPVVLAGAGWLDGRSVLRLDFHPNDAKGERKQFFALNDAVIARGGIARIISTAVKINGEPFASYKGDGVIAATATGSTGYSYAAGGPVLYPSSEEMVLTPILPHLTRPYSIVVPRDSYIEVSVATNHQAALCVDGHINLPLATGDRIVLRRADTKVNFIRLREPGTYYRELDDKLKGNVDS